MRARFRYVIASGLVMVLLALSAPVTAAQDIDFNPTRYLRPADYTNGVTKSKFLSGSFQNQCGATWDITVYVYYDQLDANHIHITKFTTKYYILRGSKVSGGATNVFWTGMAFWEGPADGGFDFWTMYFFKSANEDAEHYALSGTFNHNVNLTFNNRGFEVDKYTYGNGGISDDCLGLASAEFKWA